MRETEPVKISSFAEEILALAKEKGLNGYELCKAAETAQKMACEAVARMPSLEDFFWLYFVSFMADYKPK